MKVIAAVIISIITLIFFTGSRSTEIVLPEELNITTLMPPNENVAKYIELYSKMYGIPTHMVYRSAKLESTFLGKNHEDYSPYKNNLVSSANAYGPLQVRVVAARDVWPELNNLSDRQIAYKLRYDLEFNIHTACKYMAKLKKDYNCKNYTELFTAYNRGIKYKDSTNYYALYISN